jgi:menaquinone-9 beta-reductase
LLGGSQGLHAAPMQISRARIFIDGKVFETRIEPPANSVPRFVLDSVLWQAAKKAGVTALEETPAEEIRGDGPFSIVAQRRPFVARAVINASGRWSNLAAGLNQPKLEASIGLKQHFLESSPPQSVDLYFFAGGYCGVQPVGGNEVNASAMVSAGVAKSLAAVFQLEPNLRKRTESWKPATEPVTTFPLIFKHPNPVQRERNIVNAGDAAGFIDPFVGDGISMALHSGRMASDCLAGFLRGDHSLREAASEYRTLYEERLLPAFRNAARLRKLIASPSLRGLAMELFRVPAISRFALRKTRARTA